MNSRTTPWLWLSFLLLVLPTMVRAGDITQYLPEDALGFVLIRNLDEANSKINKLIRTYELPLPAPLDFIKSATRLGGGINMQGNILIALLPAENPSSDLVPMVLLPITDYRKFATSVKGDVSGEICRVSIAEEDVLIAKEDDFALLMNIEHRETLELLLGLEPEPVVDLHPIDAWQSETDVMIALMPTGLKMLLRQGQDALAQQRVQLEQQLEKPQFAALGHQMKKNLETSEWMLSLVGSHLQLAAVGMRIDSQNNLHLGKRLVLKKDSSLVQNTPPLATHISPLAGFANQPFVLAGGGPIPQDWVDTWASFTRKMMERMSEIYGLEDLPPDQWNELEEVYRGMMVGMDNFSLIMLPGEEGQPLFSNIYGIAKVQDAEQYVQNYMKSTELWNAITAQSTSDILLVRAVHPKEVDGAKGCEIVVDVADAASDPNVPIFNWMLKSMFGEGGKMHQLLLAIDQNTLVYTMGEEEDILSLMQQARHNEMGLSNNSAVQVTVALLQDDAPWILLISPSGCVRWTDRLMKEILVHLREGSVTIPEFDACPPIGVSVGLNQRRLECDMVWPAETLQALAVYIKKCKNL